jgi:hypothetical protein
VKVVGAGFSRSRAAKRHFAEKGAFFLRLRPIGLALRAAPATG